MIFNLKVVEGNSCVFKYKGDFKILNAIRGCILNINNPLYSFNVTKVQEYDKSGLDIPITKIKNVLKYIYVNNDKLKNVTKKVIGTFNLDVYSIDSDFTYVSSGNIELRSKYSVDFNRKLYLFMLLRGQKINISGNIEKMQQYIVCTNNYVQKSIGDNTYQVSFTPLGIYNHKNCVIHGIYKLIHCFKELKKQCIAITPGIIEDGIEIEFNQNIDYNRPYFIPYIVDFITLEVITQTLQKHKDLYMAAYQSCITNRYNYKLILRSNKPDLDFKKILMNSINEKLNYLKTMLKSIR